METTSVSSRLAATGVATSADVRAEILAVLFDLRWAVACIAVLVIADFWFGVTAALRRGEHFRFSRAGRRTMDKLVSYICYLLIGAVVGLGILEPLSLATHTQAAAVCIGLAALFEIDSVSDHVCELHGIRKRFSLKRFIIYYLKKKSPDAGQALEETLNTTTPHAKD